MQTIMVAGVPGCYGRHSVAEIISNERLTCDVCGQNVPCLSVDTSDGEYGYVSLCLACITAAFGKLSGEEV